MPIAHYDWHTPHRLDIAPGWPIRQTLSASIYFALALGAFLVIRRSTGALNTPLPPLQLAVTATLLVAWALAVRSLAPSRITAWLTAAALLSFAIAFSFPGERTVDWIVWLTAFGVYLASSNAVALISAPRSLPTMEADQQVLQQLIRSRTADGRDVAHGTLLAEFSPGERTTTLYVAFCPPFERLPLIEVESTAGVKLVQAFHHGAQFEVRLPRPAATPTTAAVEFFATDAE